MSFNTMIISCSKLTGVYTVQMASPRTAKIHSQPWVLFPPNPKMISTCQYPLSTSISEHHLDPKGQSVNVLSVCGEQMPYFRSCCTASSSPCRAWLIHWYLLGTIEKSASHHVQVALAIIRNKSNTYFVCIRMKSPLIFLEKFGLTWS